MNRRNTRGGAPFPNLPTTADPFRRRPPSGRAVLAYVFLAGMAAYAILVNVAVAIVEAVAP